MWYSYVITYESLNKSKKNDLIKTSELSCKSMNKRDNLSESDSENKKNTDLNDLSKLKEDKKLRKTNFVVKSLKKNEPNLNDLSKTRSKLPLKLTKEKDLNDEQTSESDAEVNVNVDLKNCAKSRKDEKLCETNFVNESLNKSKQNDLNER